MGNGYAYQLIFNHFEDVEKIKDLNWCRFLLECLVDTHGKWIHKQNQPFTGPLLFLTVCCIILQLFIIFYVFIDVCKFTKYVSSAGVVCGQVDSFYEACAT
nr:uncharacterized protein LOC109190399 [Ipomoea batatas]